MDFDAVVLIVIKLFCTSCCYYYNNQFISFLRKANCLDMTQDFLLKETNNGYKIMQYDEICPNISEEGLHNIDCNRCINWECQLEKNQYYVGYEITPEYIEHCCENIKDVGKAWILSREDGLGIIEGINNSFLLISNAIDNIIHKNQCCKSNYIIQKYYDKYCLNIISEDGEYSSFRIDSGSIHLFKKYYNKIIYNAHDIFGMHPIKTDEKELNQIIYENAERIFITEDGFHKVNSFIRNSVKMIYNIAISKYKYVLLRSKYLNLCDENELFMFTD